METPSRTSQAVALFRSTLTRDRTPGGAEDAQRRMLRGIPPAPLSPRLRAQIADRTAFVDRAVLDALAAGVEQVVVIGAGYDDRALRFAAPGVRFFEVDHPSTQADKASRVAALAAEMAAVPAASVPAASVPPTVVPPTLVPPTFVPADLRASDLPELLTSAGLARGSATLFICEGLVVYLDEPTIARVFGALRGLAGPGSALAVTLAMPPEGVDPAEALAKANRDRRTGKAEPWLTLRTEAGWRELFAEAGWRVATAERPSPTALLVRAEPAEAV